MLSNRKFLLLDRRRFLTNSSMVLAAIAGSSVLASSELVGGRPAPEIAEKKYAQNAAPVYMYMFTHESNFVVPGTNHRLGAAHATEIWYKFNNVDIEGPNDPKDPSRPGLIGTDADREQTGLNMSEMWTTFARTGRPGAKGQPLWPAYTLPKRSTMMIDAQCRIEDDPFGQERAMWDALSS